MENYKEKYENLIEKLKKAKEEHGGYTFSSVVDNILQKLCESEDEKIRKEIVGYLKSQGASKRWDFSTWIAWLEKQGESIKIKKGKNYLCTKTHKYAGVEWIEGVKYYSPEDYSLVNQGCTCYCPKYSKEEHNNFFKEVEHDGCPEKQSEQKPAWNEEDTKMMDFIINILECAPDMRPCSEVYYESAYQKQINWLKSIKPNHWKPSEYDISLLEEIARNIRNNVRPFCSEVSSLEELIGNLKNL